jgi:hypothetical protein
MTTEVRLFTFSASSKGSIGAVGVLSKIYGQQMRQRPGQYPVVSLGVNSYQHSNRSLGRIKFPVFAPTGLWVPKKAFTDLLSVAGIEASNSTEVATTETMKNAFEVYGDAASPTKIVGDLLKFSKGDYFAGVNSEEIPMGTELVACMDSLLIGYVKWQNNKPVEQIMGLLVEGFQPPRRKDLGDTDEAEWEENDDGSKRDPWTLTNQLVMSTVPESLRSQTKTAA